MKNVVIFISLCIISIWDGGVSNAQLIVAHRGASFDAPENTRAAFHLAWAKSADAIEGDFYLTRDQKIVCSHDATTERVSGINLPVAQSTLAELQELDVGRWKDKKYAFERMPSLHDVLSLVPSDKSIFIEIKSGPDIVPFLQCALEELRISTRQAFIISFNEDVIRTVKKEIPRYKAYWLVSFSEDEQSGKWTPTVEEVIATAKKINADGVNLNANTEVVNAPFVDRCHRAGLSVHVWTVDNLEKAILLQKMGVDSITTNRPGQLRKGLFPPKASPSFSSSVSSPPSAPTASPIESQAEPIVVP